MQYPELEKMSLGELLGELETEYGMNPKGLYTAHQEFIRLDDQGWGMAEYTKRLIGLFDLYGFSDAIDGSPPLFLTRQGEIYFSIIHQLRPELNFNSYLRSSPR
jgi:hypothetical protein